MQEFSQDSLDTTIAGSELLSRTELVAEGKRMAWDNFSGCAAATADGIQLALAAGLTIIVRRFDYEHAAASALAVALSAQIQKPVFATLFIAKRLGATFPAHYDSADVFAVQISGVKRWELFDRVSPPPASDADVYPIESPVTQSLFRKELSRGDLLYVPRGTIHMVEAVSGPSVHISFGALAAPSADTP